MSGRTKDHICDPDERRAEYDARGIFLCYACPKCRKRKIAGYRPEILTNPRYEADDLGDDDDLGPDSLGDWHGRNE